MISPFMAGKTTSERCDVASRSRLKLSDRKHLLKQIAEGMAYLHGEKVVHGDLRGPNVFLTTTGDVKIADFGLCVYASGVSQNYFSMRTGNTRWIAPELMNTNSVQDEGLRQERERLELENARDPDRITINRPTISSDVYSFACTCIELIDGRVPYYDQKTDPAVIRFVTIENGRPPRPRELSGTHDDTVLWEIIQRCWASVESGSLRPTFAEVYKQLGRVV
ncbi:kinase-like domain-containing protein [Irpex rosettiformis]|uniref:Kinase-like domain-containing protein n=1 Tax=Irpex rosettiformis TaxID=378272 RepID=A0ACB8U3L2_9APHY|nr:kinase-like domain-containing protein [Irpex rosettiformis]